jgi:integrase
MKKTAESRPVAELGYSLQANVKTIEGTQHPDRDAQFRYLNDEKILTACEKREMEVQTPGYRNAQRLKTLVLLLRYSGMRIGDAVALSADRLQDSKLLLYRQKTGVPVYTVLPDFVAKALEATPRVTPKLFFWTGQGKLETAVKDWPGRLRHIFELGPAIR